MTDPRLDLATRLFGPEPQEEATPERWVLLRDAAFACPLCDVLSCIRDHGEDEDTK